MAGVILFDVNETLLDTRALDPYFERVLGSASTREHWFKELEGLWLVTIATGVYQDFTELVEAALEMTADQEGVELSDDQRAELPKHMNVLPPYPDAVPALTKLQEAGHRLAALTNGTLESARAQLQHAELEDFFEEVFSADEVERYKPAPEPYHMTTERLQVKPEEICLTAAHAWDIAGAHAAGLETAFVRRPRKAINPAGPRPDLYGDDLLELTEQMVSKDA